ncbi:MAG: hypothetical protein Q7J79_12230 [Gemmatimonadales bacterium]|nr:hypothetical protein [Gemmatimonadales bacterium]
MNTPTKKLAGPKVSAAKPLYIVGGLVVGTRRDEALDVKAIVNEEMSQPIQSHSHS